MSGINIRMVPGGLDIWGKYRSEENSLHLEKFTDEKGRENWKLVEKVEHKSIKE